MKNAPFQISEFYFTPQSLLILALAVVIGFVLLLNLRREVATFAMIAFVVGAVMMR